MVFVLENQKFKKQFFRNNFKQKNYNKQKNLHFSAYGLKVIENGFITEKQLETVNQKILLYTKKEGLCLYRINTLKPITKKNVGERMGSGSGGYALAYFAVQEGSILFEFIGISKYKIIKILKDISFFLNLKIQVVRC